jgi:hypothetical protein
LTPPAPTAPDLLSALRTITAAARGFAPHRAPAHFSCGSRSRDGPGLPPGRSRSSRPVNVRAALHIGLPALRYRPSAFCVASSATGETWCRHSPSLIPGAVCKRCRNVVDADGFEPPSPRSGLRKPGPGSPAETTRPFVESRRELAPIRLCPSSAPVVKEGLLARRARGARPVSRGTALTVRLSCGQAGRYSGLGCCPPCDIG